MMRLAVLIGAALAISACASRELSTTEGSVPRDAYGKPIMSQLEAPR